MATDEIGARLRQDVRLASAAMAHGAVELEPSAQTLVTALDTALDRLLAYTSARAKVEAVPCTCSVGLRRRWPAPCCNYKADLERIIREVSA